LKENEITWRNFSRSDPLSSFLSYEILNERNSRCKSTTRKSLNFRCLTELIVDVIDSFKFEFFIQDKIDIKNIYKEVFSSESEILFMPSNKYIVYYEVCIEDIYIINHPS
jgi:hypothetical protein